jgi:membrane protease YdiL (CAAX protease family)
MKVILKEAGKTTGLIILSLASIVLVYFAIEPITDYLDEAGYFWLSILSNASVAIIIYFLVRWFNKKVNRLTVDDYGFGIQGVVKKFLIGACLSVLLVSLTLFLTSFFADTEIELLSIRNTNPISLIDFLIANLVVAAWEEMYFRGLVVTTLLKKKLSFTWTAVISSGLFTVVHVTSYDLSTIGCSVFSLFQSSCYSCMR